MYLTILSLPLISSIVSGLFGRKIGVNGTHILACSLLVVSAILSILTFFEVGISASPVSISLNSWLLIDYLDVQWSFYFDQVTVSMTLAVLVVSSVVHIFSVSYMQEDPFQQRFFSYLSLFTFFMLILVAGDNYIVMFLGWEGIGITSFVLISFWTTRQKANKAALSALLTNRFGDLVLTIGLFTLIASTSTLDYSSLYALVYNLNESTLTVIGICFLVGAMAKSAQLGLHNWLPVSMEGPTPVSSLIHAATLVTAGVYLLIRTSPVLEFTSTSLATITIVGSISCFYAASIGLFQNDIKRIIAFSTQSQIAYMIIAIGLSQYNTALFHLVNHAFFKALLFLSAGAILHATMDQQDIRRLGGMLGFVPFIYTCFLIGSLSLMAIIGMTGFYSKDFIIELAGSKYYFQSNIALILGTMSAGLTAFYSYRILTLVFYSLPNASSKVYNSAHDADNLSMIAMTVLALFSVYFGYLTRDIYVGFGTDFFSQSIFILPINQVHAEAEFALTSLHKIIPLILTLLGAGIAISLYTSLSITILDYHRLQQYSARSATIRSLYAFFANQWYFDQVYAYLFTFPSQVLAYIISKSVDKGILEKIGPQGLTNSTLEVNQVIKSLDNAVVTTYALLTLVAFISFLAIILFTLSVFPLFEGNSEGSLLVYIAIISITCLFANV